MTIRLCDDDPYLKECTALVTSCKQGVEGYITLLDCTCFHPQGGGQPADRGRVDGIEVLTVYEDNGEVYHLLQSPVEVGKTVKLSLDWDFRFDAMQQHLGQHIFSCMAEGVFGAKTLAARIEEGVSHVEFDKALDLDQLIGLEKCVNQTIKADIPVFVHNYTAEQGKELGLPSHYFTHPIIRIVEIAGLERNPCGGTHPSSTGQVKGCIITGTKEVRGAFRVYYKFGKRVGCDRRQALDVFLSTQQALGIYDKTDILPQVTALQELNQKNRVAITKLGAQLVEADLALLLATAQTENGVHLVLGHFEERDNIKELVDRLTLEHKAVVLLTNKVQDTLSVVISQTKGLSCVNPGGIVKELLATYTGRGGGGPVTAQCNIAYSEEALLAATGLFKKALNLA